MHKKNRKIFTIGNATSTTATIKQETKTQNIKGKRKRKNIYKLFLPLYFSRYIRES